MEQRTLGDYRLIKQLGQGTLGCLFLAEHRFMKRQYALKILPEELASDRGFIQRFEEEVGVLSSLDHPGIVKIHNVSFVQGQYFLVMDCVVDDIGEPTNLAKYLVESNHALQEEEVYQILSQIADALDYAHTKKVGSRDFVHRSLKPNNILIGKKQRPEVFLSDFGLSRMIGSGAVLTRTFKVIADTLELSQQLYMQLGAERYPNPPIEQYKLAPLQSSFIQNYTFLAPEQKRLDPTVIIDAKADSYAFGVLAYYLLTGELPEGIFVMPSKKRACHYEWDELIDACLQADPSKRPLQLLPLLRGIDSKKASIAQKKREEEVIVSEPSAQPECSEEFFLKYSVSAPSESNISPLQEVLVGAMETTSMPDAPAVAISVPFEDSEQVVESARSVSLKPNLQSSMLERPQTDLDPGAIFQTSSTIKSYSPERKDVTNVKPILTDMVVVPGGVFYRGSHDGNRDEMPRHQVSLASFAIDVHPVTNEQFVRFLEVMGGEKDSSHNNIIRLRDSRIKRSAGRLSIESGYAKHPVVGVTWYGAVAYAKWIGKRLPTEAEWEIAARGGRETAIYPTGNDVEKSQANFFSSDTTAVMSYAPNGCGLYDMAGNVYEWCHDWYGYSYYEISTQEPENPLGPLQGVYRVLRGGCWKSLKEDLRCFRRHRNNPGTVNGTYGFRCASGVQ